MRIVLIVILLIGCQCLSKKCNSANTAATGKFALMNPFTLDNICPPNSHCLQNNYCACDSGYVGGCTQKANNLQHNVQITAYITHSQYTFFYLTQDSDAYVMLIFNLCHQSESSNLETIDVWEDIGNIEVLNKSNSIPGSKDWPISSGCLKLNTPLMKFNEQQNGLSQNFVLGMKLVNQGNIKVTLSVQIDVFDFWDLFQKFLIIISAIFLFIITMTIVFIFYKWRRRRNVRENAYGSKDISHIESHMPKFKLDSKNRFRISQEICSVCLLQFVNTEWLRKTVCGHIFHQQCIDQWCKSSLNCPICRKSFEENDIKDEISTIQNIQNMPINNSIRNSLIEQQ